MKAIRKLALLTGFIMLLPVWCSSQETETERKLFKLAVAQMKVIGGDRKANLKHAGEMIMEAAGQGSQFILLPEAMDLGWTDPSALTEAEPVPEGKTARFLSEMAKKYQVYICSGLIEKEGETVYNSAIILDSQGEVILLHRKINGAESPIATICHALVFFNG